MASKEDANTASSKEQLLDNIAGVFAMIDPQKTAAPKPGKTSAAAIATASVATPPPIPDVAPAIPTLDAAAADEDTDEGDDDDADIQAGAIDDIDDGDMDDDEKEEAVEYPEGTPDIVANVLNTIQSAKKAASQLLKEAKDHPEVKAWAERPGNKGRVKAVLQKYADVKKILRKHYHIKPGGVRPTTTPSAETAAKNIAIASDVMDAVTSSPVEAQPTALNPDTEESGNAILAAMTPGTTPKARITNKKTGEVFMMWSDFLAIKVKDYELRFRKFTAGESSKLGASKSPSAYLMKEDRVLAALSPEEFIVVVNMVGRLTQQGSLKDILSALVALAK